MMQGIWSCSCPTCESDALWEWLGCAARFGGREPGKRTSWTLGLGADSGCNGMAMLTSTPFFALMDDITSKTSKRPSSFEWPIELCPFSSLLRMQPIQGHLMTIPASQTRTW